MKPIIPTHKLYINIIYIKYIKSQKLKKKINTKALEIFFLLVNTWRIL